jgi:hypothetical protein
MMHKAANYELQILFYFYLQPILPFIKINVDQKPVHATFTLLNASVVQEKKHSHTKLHSHERKTII